MRCKMANRRRVPRRGASSVDPLFEGMHRDAQIVRHGGLGQAQVSLPLFQFIGVIGFDSPGYPGAWAGFVG